MKTSLPSVQVLALGGLSVCVAVAASCATSGNNSAGVGGSSATGAGATPSATGAGGGADCTGCVTTANCGAGRDCAQFAGDTYCAADCTAGQACPTSYACTPVNTAEGKAVSVCVPVTNTCGGSGNTTGAGGSPSGAGASTTTTTTGTSTTTSTSGGGTCSHSPCSAGARLTNGCEACVTTVCAGDSYCCDTSWDASCVTEASSACDCAGGSTSSSSSTSSTSSTSSSTSSSSGSVGTVGPTGGTLGSLSFAIVGDTRPANEDDPSGYPTAIITKIWQDVEAASPRPAFAVSTGDYMFASPSHTPGTQATQMGYYLTARAAFSNIQFPAMGNHECDGATADNCYACGSACTKVGGTCVSNVCQTPNYGIFLGKMLTPIGQSLPYYTINVNGTGNAWTSKFVFVACNAWSPTQASWLAAQLSTPTTYTFVVRHEGTTATTAPCLSGTGTNNADTLMGQHPYTLLIAGHTHTYAYYASERQVIVGNGGAPLSGSVDYGYVIARQSGSSIVFTSYDYQTNAVVQTFTVN
jgi:hypothetical protein